MINILFFGKMAEVDIDKMLYLSKASTYLNNLKCKQAAIFSAHYNRLRMDAAGDAKLPTKNFDPQSMCSYCGTMWSSSSIKTRIKPAKRTSKNIKKIINSTSILEQRIPKVRLSLVKKSIKNQMNKLEICCPTCLRKTELPFTKPKKVKPVVLNEAEKTPTICNKKKKKRRDKTAGLNISSNSTLNTSTKDLTEKCKPSEVLKVMKNQTCMKLHTSTPKTKKLNLDKLKEVMGKGSGSSKKNSLKSFLQEIF